MRCFDGRLLAPLASHWGTLLASLTMAALASSAAIAQTGPTGTLTVRMQVGDALIENGLTGVPAGGSCSIQVGGGAIKYPGTITNGMVTGSVAHGTLQLGPAQPNHFSMLISCTQQGDLTDATVSFNQGSYYSGTQRRMKNSSAPTAYQYVPYNVLYGSTSVVPNTQYALPVGTTPYSVNSFTTSVSNNTYDVVYGTYSDTMQITLRY